MHVCVCVCVCLNCVCVCVYVSVCVYNVAPQYFHHNVFSVRSCTFEGSHDELSTHLDTCSYEKLKGFLGRTDDHIQQLQDELKKKDEV